MKITDVMVVFKYDPNDQILMLFIREPDREIDLPIYRKTLHRERDNQTAVLMQKLFEKGEINAKELAEIVGECSIKKKVNRAFDFLPQHCIKAFFPKLKKNHINFIPAIRLIDFVAENERITFKIGNRKKQSSGELEQKTACYLFDVQTDGSYKLELRSEHEFVADNQLYIDCRFYDKGSIVDWQLFFLPKGTYIELMRLSPIPELDSVEVSNTLNTST